MQLLSSHFPTGHFLQQAQHTTSQAAIKLVESVEFIYQTASGDHNETIGGLDSVYLLHNLLNPQFPPQILASSRTTSKTNLPGLSFCLAGFELQNPATGTLALTSRAAHKNCLLHLSVQTYAAHHLAHPSLYKAEKYLSLFQRQGYFLTSFTPKWKLLRKVRGRKCYLDALWVFVYLVCFISYAYLDVLVVSLSSTQSLNARERSGSPVPVSSGTDHPKLDGKSLLTPPQCPEGLLYPVGLPCSVILATRDAREWTSSPQSEVYREE